MPKVQGSLLVEKSADYVYEVAKDIERFPEFMPDVESVNILEQTANGRQISHWVGIIKEFRRTIQWTEEDYWDAENRVVTFRQLEGDYTEYRGFWEFKTVEENLTEVSIEVEYEYDVPLIGNLIKGLLQRKMQENIENMLQSIKARCESGAGG
jgi:uncharacterized membrane protein